MSPSAAFGVLSLLGFLRLARWRDRVMPSGAAGVLSLLGFLRLAAGGTA